MATLTVSDITAYLGGSKEYFAFFGAACLGLMLIKLTQELCSVAVKTIRRCLPLDLTKHGKWAVVTGCTDGIGKCYALQLAEKGMNIVLISRNPKKLESVQQEIVKKCSSKVMVIVADFKKTDIYPNIKRLLEGLDIGILVNNVGMLHPKMPAYHCELDDLEQYNMDIINVNVLSCVMMTSIVLPGMLERERGVIINIGSGGGLSPLPFFSVYSATKAFVNFFSRALNMEYSQHGVEVQVVNPNRVESNMTLNFSQAAGLSLGLMYPSADTFVAKAIRTIGRESATGAYWPHELQQFFFSRMKDSRLRSIMLNERNKMQDLLKRD